MEITCQKCGRKYDEMFDTIVRCDYLEPGKGKPFEWHICMNCRKSLIQWFDG
jgi:NMD protein affecting ribosome stability and mRNA decay